MNLAAIESSTHHLSVALSCAGELRQRSAVVVNGGSAMLLPWLQELLAEAGIGLAALDALAFGAGPGGFTGLRLACGLVQGLALGLDLPVLGVCGLEAMALQAGSGKVVAALDARMGEIYYACYAVAGDAVEILAAPVCASPQQLSPPPGSGWIGCGDAFSAYPQLWRDELAGRREDLLPTAAAVVRLAAPRLQRGEGVDAALAAPLYVRDKVALTTAERLARGGQR